MFFPEQASSAAEKVDNAFLFIFALCVAFFIFITVLMVFFVVKYSKKRHPVARDIAGHTGLEIAWTVIPLVLFLAMFYYGWTNFEYLRAAPRDAMVVKAIGRQWAWQFEYPNGKLTTELYCAIGKPVRVEIRSVDVLHGFYIPAFRIKMDAVPGRENYTWFAPTKLGDFDIECSVICGTNHSYMLSKAVVVTVEEFNAWFSGGAEAPLPGGTKTASILPPNHPGLSVLREKTCLSCHSTDGSAMVGPTFHGAFGSKETVIENGVEREVVVDERFIARAVREPNAALVKGYPPAMPLIPVSDDELQNIIGYLRILKEDTEPQ
jgi:cytochrome c oxidase subunit 2